MIALIDYGMGNIKSVSKALETTGIDVKSLNLLKISGMRKPLFFQEWELLEIA